MAQILKNELKDLSFKKLVKMPQLLINYSQSPIDHNQNQYFSGQLVINYTKY